MPYVRTHWTNNLTQLNAKNMNNIEDGIEENTEHISQSDAEITSLKTRMLQAETDIENVNDAITAEVSARQAADTTLQSNITSEVTTRQNTDTQLQGQITSNYNELDGREEALNTRVTALEEIHTTYSDPNSDGNIVIASTDV